MLRENYGPSPAAKARHLVRPSVRVRPSFVLSFFRLSSCGCSGSAISNPLICVGLWSASWVPKSITMRHQSRQELLWEFPSSAWIWTRLSDGWQRHRLAGQNAGMAEFWNWDSVTQSGWKVQEPAALQQHCRLLPLG